MKPKRISIFHQLSKGFAVILTVAILLNTFKALSFATEVLESGTCGDSATWVLTDDGTLTISGTGEMIDYNSPFKNNTSIQSVIIENGITNIGSYAFQGCSELRSISIPASVNRIDCCAFDHCSRLASITVPDTVTSISWGAFQYCTELSNVTLPRNLSSIEDQLFQYCTSLSSISIPADVTTIDAYAFRGCTTLSSVIIPDGVTSLGNYAFYGCTSLLSISIPDGVTDIGDYAFANCSSLAEITISDSVTKIGNGAFSSTVWYDNQPDGLVYIGTIAYEYKGKYDMPENTSVIIRDGTTVISDNLFSYSNLSSVSIPESVVSIGDYAFTSCSSLTSIAIPDGVTHVGKYAFYGCSGIISITIPSALSTIEEKVFGFTGIPSISIPGTVKTIEPSAFYACNNLETVDLQDGIEVMAGNAFDACSSLEQITLPKTLRSISSGAFFRDNPALKNILVDSDNAYYCSIDGVLFNKAGTILYRYPQGKTAAEYSIPDGTEELYNYSFSSCDGVQGISFPASLAKLGYYTFENCSGLSEVTLPQSIIRLFSSSFYRCENLEAINVAESNETYCSVDGVLFTEDMTTLMTYPCGKQDAEYAVPAGVTEIDSSAFHYTKLEKVTIPEGVTRIKEYTFRGSDKLCSIVLPQSLTYISDDYDSAFMGTPLKYVFYTGSQEAWDSLRASFRYQEKVYVHCNATDHTIGEYVVRNEVSATCTQAGSYDAGYECIGADGCDYLNEKEHFDLGTDPSAHTDRYLEGQSFSFGKYPKSLVADETIITALNALLTDDMWVSFGYTSGDGSIQSAVSSDYMKYADVELNGETYRAVTFSNYRPGLTFNEFSDRETSVGYQPNETYWFKYESLTWKILDAETGLVVCEEVIDSQPMNNIPLRPYNLEIYNNSYLSEWLNNNFFDLAFSEAESEKISNAVIDARISNGNRTIDHSVDNKKIFILSRKEMVDYSSGESAGYVDGAECPATDYARINGNTSYYLRTTDQYYFLEVWSGTSRVASINTSPKDYWPTECKVDGVRPAFFINEIPQAPESIVEGYEPTCTETGLTDGVKCVRCGEWISEPETILALGHDYHETGRVDATCTEPGLITYVCSRDASHTYTEPIEPTGHAYGLTGWTWTETVEGYAAVAHFVCANDPAHKQDITAVVTSETDAPDCENGGETVYTARVTFEGNPYSDTKTVTLDPTGHTYGLTGWTWTETAEGYAAVAHFVCANDPAHKQDVTAVVTPVTDDPDCENGGETIYTARVTFEGTPYSDTKTVTLDPTGHNYELTGWTWTETPDGYDAVAHFVCANDPAHKQDVTAVITAEKTDPKCLNSGKIVYTARVTFEEKPYSDIKTVLIDALGHDLIHHEGKAATCIVKGWEAYDTCSRCDYTTYKEIPALGHKYVSSVTQQPTCTEKGVRTYVCQNDSSHTYIEDINPLGHNFGSWFTVKEATIDETGLERRECSRCDAFEERIIPKLNDNSKPCSFFDKIVEFFAKLIAMFVKSFQGTC